MSTPGQRRIRSTAMRRSGVTLRRRHAIISTGGERRHGDHTAEPTSSGPAERRRRELLEAADRVVLRDGPEASMNAIAAEAGITKPILYRHFGDKGGLYRALAKRHTDALLDALRAALDAPAERRERVEATLDTYLAAIEARPQVYRFLMHPAEDAARRASRASTSAGTRPRCCAGSARSWPR